MNKISVNPLAKALIFDLDGTLADTMPTHFKAFQTVLSRYGVQFDQELMDSLAGVPTLPQMRLIREKFNPDGFIPEKVAVEKEVEFLNSIKEMKTVQPVYYILLEYQGKMPIGCGTGGEREIAMQTLEVINATDKVMVLVSSDDVTHGKPHPETFLKVAQALGVDPKYCQVFEDGEPGIIAAKAAGMMVTDIKEYL